MRSTTPPPRSLACLRQPRATCGSSTCEHAARWKRTNDALRRFVELLTAGDVSAIEHMLAADAKAITDGGGEFTASRVPIVGAFRVARFFSRLAASRTGGAHVEIRSINGQAAALFDF